MTNSKSHRESVDIYPGLVVDDDRACGSITFGRTRTPVWVIMPAALHEGWDETADTYDVQGWDEARASYFLHTLLYARGEFARLLLELADAERTETVTGLPWWRKKRRRARVSRQLQRCLDLLDAEDEVDADGQR